MRKSSLYFLYLAVQTVLLGGLFTHARVQQTSDANHLQDKAGLVRRLGLTDLCVFTEASYTRHPSLADFHTAFQDSPMALDHFPSGSLVIPPAAGKKTHENVD
ncbi:MAG: hypothetical protein MUC98_04620 [Desulfobacterota bacterium]|jgi:hypothetical protein|nr:hypothetical protein [Thermodesulfobacteriota bacterium]